ncbi:MAG: hypothetical protein AAFZ92_11100 [Pseudomonadota bacterium]
MIISAWHKRYQIDQSLLIVLYNSLSASNHLIEEVRNQHQCAQVDRLTRKTLSNSSCKESYFSSGYNKTIAIEEPLAEFLRVFQGERCC